MLDLLLQDRKIVFCLLNSGDAWDKDFFGRLPASSDRDACVLYLLGTD